MRIKMLNVPNLTGFDWTEVTVGLSVVAGLGFSIYPF